MGAVEDGIQLRYSCDEIVLQGAYFAGLDAVLHGLQACGQAADDNLGSRYGVAALLQFGLAFYGAGQEKSRYTCIRVVFPDGVEVLIHQLVVLNGGLEMRGS